MPCRTIEAATNTAYIEPISDCNLSCRMCYSRVSRERPPISKEDCIAFADRFAQFCDGNFELYWSGTGEVFLHRDFPEIINVLSRRHTGRIRHTIMTNGTLDRLDEFDSLADVTIRVSIDGLRDDHEWNRGPGTYERTMAFIRKATALGCKAVEARALVTRGNIATLAALEAELEGAGDGQVELSTTTPITNRDLDRIGSKFMADELDDSKLMPRDETECSLLERYGERFRKSIRMDHCHTTEISLNPSGVFTCCEGMYRIGEIDTDMAALSEALVRATPKCYACPYRPGQFDKDL